MLKDTYGKTIENSFKNNKKEIRNGIIAYIDKYSNVLYSTDLTEQIYFSNEDRGILYSSFGVIESELERSIKESKDINSSFKVSSNSFYILATLGIREALIKNDDESAKLISIYMSCMMYSSMHSRFLQYKANKAIMDYTVNNLDNNFKFKKLGSLFALLEDNVITWLNTYKSKFIKGTDNDIVYIINALQTRIKGKLKKIFNEFYKNWESGKYLNMESGSYSEENYKEVDNNSYMSARLADKIYLNMIQKGISTKLLKYSITRSDTSYTKLKTIIEDIVRNDDDGQIRTVVQTMIDYYIRTSGNTTASITNGEFVTYMMSSYASNSDSEQIKFIKNTIDGWLNESVSRFGTKQYGKTAIASYKKSIYMFFVYTININSKI